MNSRGRTNTARVIAGFAMVAAVVVAVPQTGSATVCVQGANLYRLNGLPKSKTSALEIKGAVIGEEVPVSGSGYVASDGTAVIGLTESYDFGSGAWVNPTGDTVIKFPAASTTGTYDTTYLGATNPPNSFTGTATIVPCPSKTFLSPSDADAPQTVNPNAR